MYRLPTLQTIEQKGAGYAVDDLIGYATQREAAVQTKHTYGRNGNALFGEIR